MLGIAWMTAKYLHGHKPFWSHAAYIFTPFSRVYLFFQKAA